jgi:hypothetical protein
LIDDSSVYFMELTMQERGWSEDWSWNGYGIWKRGLMLCHLTNKKMAFT